MKCPHCTIEIHPAFNRENLNGGQRMGFEDGKTTFFHCSYMECPSCHRGIIYLNKTTEGSRHPEVTLIFPKGSSRQKAAKEVPIELATDFDEAGTVLDISTKASAALSRRCLQQLLRMQGFTQHDLAKAIDAVLASKTIPSQLAQNLDAIRNIGNFAAHPIKDTNSGAIVEVEPEEAEWNLDVLEGLFDHYYVQPAHNQARIDALNAKLIAAGKPAMKQ